MASECLRLGLVGEDYVHILLHDVVQESVVGLHYVVGGHVYGDVAAGFLGQFYCLSQKLLVLHQIAFDKKVVVSMEIFGPEVFRA